MIPVFVIVAVLLAMLGIVWTLYLSQRRAHDEAEISRQRMELERERVIDFMRLMVEALGEGLGRREMTQRIVRATVFCSDAMSACFFEPTENGMLRATAVEGLFPPQRALANAGEATTGTRARLIEWAVKPYDISTDAGFIGRVFASGQGELLADAASSPDIPRHADPALQVSAMIALPIVFEDRNFGVLAVANSAEDPPLTAHDYTLLESLAEQAALVLHLAETKNSEP